jgi:hypothetical protein
VSARRDQLRAYSRFAALAWDHEHDAEGDLSGLLETFPASERFALLDLCVEILERNTLQTSADDREPDWAAQRDPDYVVSFAVRLRAAAYRAS